MMYDRVCEIAERYPGLLPIEAMAKAALFKFEWSPRGFFRKPEGADPLGWLNGKEDQFVLPFRSVAIEDPAGVIFLLEPSLEATEKMTRPADGLDIHRWHLAVAAHEISMKTYLEFDEADDPKAVKEMEERLKSSPGTIGSLVISVGYCRIHSMNYKTYQWDTEFRAKHVLLIRDNKVQTVVEEKHDLEDLFSHEMQNIIVGLKEMIFIQMSRDYFVLEESPRREVPEFRSHRPKGRGPHIARSSDRKVYTLLKPAAIRTRMELPTPTGRTQTPHERRAHLRTFRSPRFKRAVGKTIAIPSTWIGPKENMVGGKRYRVLTDFGLKEPHE